jgi:hypothetical protein
MNKDYSNIRSSNHKDVSVDSNKTFHLGRPPEKDDGPPQYDELCPQEDDRASRADD